MKKSFQLFLLFFSTLLSAQTYNNPLILFRHNKSAAITSIQILPKSIKVDLEYLGSAKYMDGWISISQGTKLTTQDGLSAKIIKGENIAFSPQKTPTVKNKIQKFSLYFEKSDIIMTIAARANMKMNMNEYSSIVDTHIKSNIVAAIKNIVSVRFIKSPA